MNGLYSDYGLLRMRQKIVASNALSNMFMKFIRHIERDSLNSYEDENDYREEDDEIFDEIDFPQSPNEKDVADYVNLNEMFLLGTRDDYGAIMKTAPALPVHRPPNQWETKLYQMAERCLSTVINDDDTAQCSTLLNKAHLNDNVYLLKFSHLLKLSSLQSFFICDFPLMGLN
ncbi:unnamed protein product [Toxocara canis]|uniref:Condensin complex subunit 2 n=1 Tax=Toxocara canis TaxID=6265 RepID=A0A183U412_TOXCA|nr:unnamed protein product [Toxocara canis]